MFFSGNISHYPTFNHKTRISSQNETKTDNIFFISYSPGLLVFSAECVIWLFVIPLRNVRTYVGCLPTIIHFRWRLFADKQAAAFCHRRNDGSVSRTTNSEPLLKLYSLSYPRFFFFYLIVAVFYTPPFNKHRVYLRKIIISLSHNNTYDYLLKQNAGLIKVQFNTKSLS